MDASEANTFNSNSYLQFLQSRYRYDPVTTMVEERETIYKRNYKNSKVIQTPTIKEPTGQKTKQNLWTAEEDAIIL